MRRDDALRACLLFYACYRCRRYRAIFTIWLPVYAITVAITAATLMPLLRHYALLPIVAATPIRDYL